MVEKLKVYMYARVAEDNLKIFRLFVTYCVNALGTHAKMLIFAGRKHAVVVETLSYKINK